MVAGSGPALGHMRWLGALQNIFGSKSIDAEESALPLKPAPVSPVVAAIRTGGDCGPDSAAWLLNEHGPPLYRAEPCQTPASVRLRLQQAWISWLKGQNDDELRAFVHQRLEQVPKAAEATCLDIQVEVILQGILYGEHDELGANDLNDSSDTHSQGPGDTGGSPIRPPPYWILPVDWARLSEAYQVDFVLHGLPGTLQKRCADCGTNGHIHTGPRKPGMDLCLHVGWCSTDSSSNWGHWEPLGAGPIASPDVSIPDCLPDPGNLPESRKPLDGTQLCVKVFTEFPLCKTENATCRPGIVGIATSTCAGASGFSCRRSPCIGDDCCPSCPPQRDSIRAEDSDASVSLQTAPGCSGPIHGDLIPPDVQEPASAAQTVSSIPTFPSPQSVASGHGVRICFLFEGPEFPKEQELRSEIASCIAKASTICSSRVRIADAGPPLARRPIARRQRVAPTERSAERPAGRPADTGAGVLPLLDPESGAETDPELTPEAPRSAVQEDEMRESQGTRVLIAIREAPPSKDGTAEEEVSAMQALEILLTVLEDPESQLQQDLQRLSYGCRVKVWGSVAPSAHSRLESRYGCRDLRSSRGSPKALGLQLCRRSQPLAISRHSGTTLP